MKSPVYGILFALTLTPGAGHAESAAQSNDTIDSLEAITRQVDDAPALLYLNPSQIAAATKDESLKPSSKKGTGESSGVREMKAQQALINQLNAQLARQQTMINTLTHTVENSQTGESELADVKHELMESQQANDELKQKLSVQNSQQTASESDLQKTLKTSQDKESTLQTVVDKLTNDVSAKTQQIATLTNDVSAKTQQIATLTNDASAKTQQIATLTKDSSAKAQQITTLTNDASAKTQQIATLTNDALAKTQQITTLTNDASAKAQQITTLTNDASAKAQQITTLTNDASAKTQQIATLTKDSSTKAQQITTLTNDASAKAQQIATLTDDASAKAQQITTLTNDTLAKAEQIETLTKNQQTKAVSIAENSAAMRDYAVGTSLGKDMMSLLADRKMQGVTVDPQVALVGVEDVFNSKIRFSEDKIAKAMYEMDSAVYARQKALKEQTKQKDNQFLESFKKKAHVKKSDTGFYYLIDYLGNGAINATSNVEIVVKESLTDGTVIKDMDRSGTTVMQPMAAYSGLFKSALSQLQDHGSMTLVVPPELAYGEQGLPPSIPPSATMVYNIRIVSVTAGEDISKATTTAK